MNRPVTPLTPLFTFEDFCVLVREDQKADLLDGVIYMASPEGTEANELFVSLITVINVFVRRKALGKVYGSRVAFRLDDTSAPEPDIAFVRKDRLGFVKKGGVDGPPDLAVEIVSPESVERDYTKKLAKYEEAGVQEYWIIDQAARKVFLFRLDRKGKYRQARPKKGVLHSQVLPGFWLRIEWLWQTPFPDHLDVLNEILADETEKGHKS